MRPELEYHEVTIPAIAPGGNRDGLSPTCSTLSPYFAEGWRVNKHRYTGDGHAQVELFRAKGQATGINTDANVATPTAPLEAGATSWPARHAAEAVIMQLAKGGHLSGAGPVDLRTPAEKAADNAHVAKLRGLPGVPPFPTLGEAVAGAAVHVPLPKAPAPPVPRDTAGLDAWLMDMGAWIPTLDLEPARAERLRAAALTLAAAHRRVYAPRVRQSFLVNVADAFPEGLEALDETGADFAALGAWGQRG